jgi:hypothetical protein
MLKRDGYRREFLNKPYQQGKGGRKAEADAYGGAMIRLRVSEGTGEAKTVRLARALFALAFAMATGACATGFVASSGRRFIDDERAALIDSASNDIPCPAAQVSLLSQVPSADDTLLLTGCGYMVSYKLSISGWTDLRIVQISKAAVGPPK